MIQTGNFIQLQTALSIFFQEAAIPPCPPGGSAHFGQVSNPKQTKTRPSSLLSKNK